MGALPPPAAGVGAAAPALEDIALVMEAGAGMFSRGPLAHAAPEASAPALAGAPAPVVGRCAGSPLTAFICPGALIAAGSAASEPHAGARPPTASSETGPATPFDPPLPRTSWFTPRNAGHHTQRRTVQFCLIANNRMRDARERVP